MKNSLRKCEAYANIGLWKGSIMPDESTTPVMPPVVDDVAGGAVSPSDSAAMGDGGAVASDDAYSAGGGTAVSAAPAQNTSVDDAIMNSPAVVTPLAPEAEPAPQAATADIPAEVARKIGESHNVLIAISSDPSVDELAAAIGLSIYLDKLGKRATAIYSGSTPNALEFLKPEETFEATADTLQDFVIALNKDKADHLRYKLDGDYVKIYITPYRHRLSEEDLDFSYGDYNVDLVLALDVANGIDLDEALREHGRIMHDAVIINITTGNPGRFGEIEWSDKKSSSVSEMIARLLYSINGAKIEKEEATAFLTGIVAATNRFSNAGTTPDTMRMASRLMESGANQQLISKNITPDMDNEMFSLGGMSNELATEVKDGDPTKLDIGHGNEKGVDESKEVSDTITEKESTLLDDLKAAEAGLAGAGAETTPEIAAQPPKIEGGDDLAMGGGDDSGLLQVAEGADDGVTNEVAEGVDDGAVGIDNAGGANDVPVEGVGGSGATDGALGGATSGESSGVTDNVVGNEGIASEQAEKVLTPSSDFSVESVDAGADKYSKMLEDALADINSATAPMNTTIASGANDSGVGTGMAVGEKTAGMAPATDAMEAAAPMDNPAASFAPSVPSNPEINGVPSINYMPMPGDEVLPPPPAPPIDMSSPAVTPSVADTNAGMEVGTSAPNVNVGSGVGSGVAAVGTELPAVDETGMTGGAGTAGVASPEPVAPAAPAQASDPTAFKIPGM